MQHLAINFTGSIDSANKTRLSGKTPHPADIQPLEKIKVHILKEKNDKKGKFMVSL
jgi:hypothetical protein